jgi:hypothetical protein
VTPGGSETSQQDGAVAADNEREAAVVQDRSDGIPNASHHRRQATRIDEVCLGVAFRGRIRERHVAIVVYFPVLSEPLNKAGLAERGGCTSDTIDDSR